MDQSDEDIHKQFFANSEPVPKLIYWASLGNLEQVKKALDEDQNVNVKQQDGYSALLAATENGHTEVVNFLLSKGAK